MRIRSPHTPETREKIRIAMLGNKNALGHVTTQEAREKIKKTNLGNKNSLGHKNSLGYKNALGHKQPEVNKVLQSIRMRGNQNGRYTHTKEQVEKHRNIMLELWQDPEFSKMMWGARNVTPNQSELRLDSILQKHFPNTWKFVGDGQLIIGGKCPDFTNINGKKQLIELFGDYWHEGQNPQDRIDYFRRWGYDCLVIWEHELDDEEKVIQLLKR